MMPDSLNEFARFLIVGLLNTIATYAIFVVFLMVLPYMESYSIAYVAGLAISYWLNSVFVFEKSVAKASPLSFVIVYLVQYLVGALLMWALVTQLSVPPKFGLAIVMLISAPATFVALRQVFKFATR
jgi:putative flippase GtrA